MINTKIITLFNSIYRSFRENKISGIPSICSAHPLVIEATLRYCSKCNAPVLIEATSNQVNQFGGYTGMNPKTFINFVESIAGKLAFPKEDILYGADHFGPNPWKDKKPNEAMELASVLVHDAAVAGFKKIHLDTSMPLGIEKYGIDFNEQLVAERQAVLCKAAEEGAYNSGNKEPPVYVIGSEVPIPGGAENYKEVKVTSAESFLKTVRLSKEAFYKAGLEDAWKRVVAVVVQPGVEFGDFYIHHYRPEDAAELVSSLTQVEGIVFEAHSTDYQRIGELRELVNNGFRILKVGPALTFAMREAMYLLAHIADELSGTYGLKHNGSLFREAIDKVMMGNRSFWEKYYKGTTAEQKFARSFSYSDRIRYYWTVPYVVRTVTNLIEGLVKGIHPVLVRQYFPDYFEAFKVNDKPVSPLELIFYRIERALKPYYDVCGYPQFSKH